MSSGQRFNRLDPSSGLTIEHQGRTLLIPIHLRGFVWDACDFQRLTPVGDYQSDAFRCSYRREGAGIPLVVSRMQQPACRFENFLPDRSVFAATFCFNAKSNLVGASQPYSFELVDPLRKDAITTSDGQQSIAKDTCAPMAYRLRDQRSTILDQFVNPGAAGSESHLYALEPYQPGKIPVVLIHGLLSDPFTWVEMVNALQADPTFVQNFQIWVFEYPTGRAFLGSAADLRQELEMIRNQFDPTHSDIALSQTVLVGHSMGGLVAKLQITDSHGQLWDAIASQPFDRVRMPPSFSDELARSFFFKASPDVSRVVYIGTPHRGSVYARRLIGRVGAALVSPDASNENAYRQLLESNPGIFSVEVSQGIPSSIDLLEPKSELLNAIDRLPIGTNRLQIPSRIHSVIGNSRSTVFFGRSDGVVPVSSARDFRSLTEITVDAKHSELHKTDEAIEEVKRILSLHLLESKQNGSARIARPRNPTEHKGPNRHFK
ncbi:MAG: alpha/beta fold hydrolase [Aureliella sp.]